MKYRTRRVVRGVVEALLVLAVIGAGVLAIMWVLGATGCTFVHIEGNNNSLEQVGGHNGWTLERAKRTDPSLKDRLIGPANEPNPGGQDQ